MPPLGSRMRRSNRVPIYLINGYSLDNQFNLQVEEADIFVKESTGTSSILSLRELFQRVRDLESAVSFVGPYTLTIDLINNPDEVHINPNAPSNVIFNSINIINMDLNTYATKELKLVFLSIDQASFSTPLMITANDVNNNIKINNDYTNSFTPEFEEDPDYPQHLYHLFIRGDENGTNYLHISEDSHFTTTPSNPIVSSIFQFIDGPILILDAYTDPGNNTFAISPNYTNGTIITSNITIYKINLQTTFESDDPNYHFLENNEEKVYIIQSQIPTHTVTIDLEQVFINIDGHNYVRESADLGNNMTRRFRVVGEVTQGTITPSTPLTLKVKRNDDLSNAYHVKLYEFSINSN